MTSRKFIELFDALWQTGPTIEYKNPENWTRN
jgi:hypothetical protein